MELDNTLSILEVKEKFKEKAVETDKDMGEKKIRFFFSGRELKGDYKLGSVINQSLLKAGLVCTIAVYAIKLPV